MQRVLDRIGSNHKRHRSISLPKRPQGQYLKRIIVVLDTTSLRHSCWWLAFSYAWDCMLETQTLAATLDKVQMCSNCMTQNWCCIVLQIGVLGSWRSMMFHDVSWCNSYHLGILTRQIWSFQLLPRWPLHASWPDVNVCLEWTSPQPCFWQQTRSNTKVKKGWHCTNCEGISTCKAVYGMRNHRGSHLASLAAETSAVLGLVRCSLVFVNRNALFVQGLPLHPSQTARQEVQPCHHQKGYGSPTMEHLSETSAEFAKTYW